MSEVIAPTINQIAHSEIPTEWVFVNVNTIAASVKNAIVGGPFGSDLVSKDYVSDGVPVIRGQNMGEHWLQEPYVFVTEEKAKALEANLARPGDIVFTQRGTLGQVSLVPRQKYERYLISQSQMKVSLNDSLVDSRYFHYWFSAPQGQATITQSAIQTGVPHINLGILRSLPLLLPPLAEQVGIASSLSDMDALIGGLDQLIAKKRDIQQAAMQQLLTGQRRLPGFSGEWSPIKMAKHASLKARIGWQALTTGEYLDEGDYYLVTGTDFIDGRVNWSYCNFVDRWRYDQDKNIQLRVSDVLLTKDGTIGKVGYIEKLRTPATLNSGIFVIRPLQESFFPLFLFYILKSKIFDEFLSMITAGSTISHLYQKDFVTFEFLAPSVVEQATIASILSDMDTELATLEARRDKARQLKQGMMQELLTGRIRLV